MDLRSLPLIAIALMAPQASEVAVGQEVPLELWTHPSFPNGIIFGASQGVSVGDFDQDGWVDLYVNASSRLWRNVQGETWVREPPPIPPPANTTFRYGSAFGDYNLDGRIDLATAPYFSGEMGHIVRGEPGGGFFDISSDPNLVDLRPYGQTETLLWFDADFDADLDLFVPGYPTWHAGPRGNWFYENLGPTGPAGAYRFRERVAQSGLSNPPGTPRPEGADLWDLDFDGDIDLFANATMYMNRSTYGVPRFDPVPGSVSGFAFDASGDREEGAVFLDYDMDGDADLLAYFCEAGARIHENLGDGTFELQPESVIEDPPAGPCLGMSAADWDNDGDMDFMTNSLFRQNLLVETGQRQFVLVSHGLPGFAVPSNTPAWFDWDKDGDLDCALARFFENARFAENTLYDSSTPEDQRRYLRVRVVRDHPTVEAGLVAEFGATVELLIDGDSSDLRRLNTVSPSGGYLNQDEYTLHFALPPDPYPADPDRDVVVSLKVDFPSNPQDGLRRIDGRVNPALSRIHVADLSDREITVYRSGRVRLNGCSLPPYPGADTVMTTTGRGLALPGTNSPLPALTPAPSLQHFVGLEFDTLSAFAPIRIKEVLLDGVLRNGGPQCGASANESLVFWDVTDPTQPFVLEDGRYSPTYRPANHRNAYLVDLVVPVDRIVRVVANMEAFRMSAFAGPLTRDGVRTTGGMSFQNLDLCGGGDVTAALIDPAQVPLTLRFTDARVRPWVTFGEGQSGTTPAVSLRGVGLVEAGAPLVVQLKDGLPDTRTTLVVGMSASCDDAGPGLPIPRRDRLVHLRTDAAGQWTWSMPLNPNLPPGTTIFLQAWWFDPGSVEGRPTSNVLAGTIE